MISTLVAATLSLVFTPTDFGASVFNTGEQNSAAFDYLQQTLVSPGESAEVQLECGTYRLARQLDLIRPITLRGAGGGPFAACTRLLFPAGSHGLYFHSHTTWTGQNDAYNRANGARISDLRISADGKTTIRHGVVVMDPAMLDKVYIENFSGDAVHLNTGMPLHSASLTRVQDAVLVNGGAVKQITSIERVAGLVTVTTSTPHYFELDTIFWLHKPGARPLTWESEFQIGQKGTITEIVSPTVFRYAEAGSDCALSAPPLDVRTGHGVYTHGGDSNACEFRAIAITGMKGCGVFEDSFLGNSYYRLMTDSNEMCAYSAGLYQANAANEFISCYSEQNQPYSYFGSPTVVVGGTHGATVLGRGTHVGASTITEVVAAVRGPAGEKVGTMQLGGSAQSYPSYLKACHDSSPFCSELVLGHPSAQLGGWSGNWLSWMRMGGSGAGLMLSMQGAVAPGGRAVDQARLALPSGFLDARGKLESSWYAKPPDSQGQNGDRMWNSNLSPGNCLLWVKVNGTWSCAILTP